MSSTFSPATQRVTLLGLGAMGSALASALLKAPNPSPNDSNSDPPSSPPLTLTLWNRSPTRPAITTLTKNPNTTFQPSLTAALAASDTVLICLLSYAAIDATLSSLGSDALRGKTVINLSNGTPAEARRLATHMCDAWGVARYIDGAVMATPEMVGTEASQIFYAGDVDDDSQEIWKLILSRLGEPIYFGADPGAAAVQDLANLAAMYGLFVGVITALGLVKRHTGASSEGGDGYSAAGGGKLESRAKAKALGPGLPSMQRFVRPLLGAILPLVDHIAKEWDEGIEEGGPHPLLMQQVALRNILRACEEQGVDGGGLAYFAEKVEEAVREGGGEGGMTLVARKFVL